MPPKRHGVTICTVSKQEEDVSVKGGMSGSPERLGMWLEQWESGRYRSTYRNMEVGAHGPSIGWFEIIFLEEGSCEETNSKTREVNGRQNAVEPVEPVVRSTVSPYDLRQAPSPYEVP